MKAVTYKVSPKGAISFYGMRRMPITLYREELDQLIKQLTLIHLNNLSRTNESRFAKKSKGSDDP